MRAGGLRVARAAAGLASAAALIAAGSAHGQALLPKLPTPAKCLARDFLAQDPEETANYAPTIGSSDLNAETANGRMAAGLTREGTVTVLRWPTPSSYDQMKHFSPDANAARAGAAPNEGSFVGLVIGGRTVWLRDFPVKRQRFASSYSDEVETSYRDGRLGLAVSVRSVVARGGDVLAQRVRIRLLPGAAERPTALVGFENLNLAVLNAPALPGADWCTEELNTDTAAWSGDAVVHRRSGIDIATGLPQSVSVVFGSRSPAGGHQVGGDAFEPTALPDGKNGPARDAYLDAADGALGGNDSYSGQTTGAIAVPLRFEAGRASEELYLAGGHDPTEAGATLAEARRRGEARLALAKRRFLRRLLRRAPMPRSRDPKVLALARRALILLATNQAHTGAIVASISTQPPYAQDWPRDGAYFNEALDRAGLSARAERHDRFYVATQATERRQPRGSLGIPPGNWAINYYENGTVGGPIPWELDETGFGAWTLWRHYRWTGDRGYLESVYPAIRRSADFLTRCRDTRTALQCRATEDDNLLLGQEQTIAGAMLTFAGLAAGERAALTLGHTDDAARYAARRRELHAAIDAQLWDEKEGMYFGSSRPVDRKFLSYVLWPVPLARLTDPRMTRHAEYLWRQLAPSFGAPSSGRTFGYYEATGLLALARFYRATDRAKLARLRAGLRWIARVQASPGTGVIGENWRVRDGRVQTITAMPHLWEHTLFYLAANAVYGQRRPGR